MPVFGLTNGMIPIISYNLGAGNRLRMLKTYRLSIVYALVIMITGMLLMIFIPDKLLMLFNASRLWLKLASRRLE